MKAFANILTLVTSTSATCLPAAAPADAAAWRLLGTVQIEEHVDGDLWRVDKTFPEPLRAAAEGFTITGYYIPIVAEPYVSQFVLVEDPANCPFCGVGGYGPVLEVHLDRPMPDLPEFTPVTLRGDLQFVEDDDTLQLYRLRDARVLSTGH